MGPGSVRLLHGRGGGAARHGGAYGAGLSQVPAGEAAEHEHWAVGPGSLSGSNGVGGRR